MDIQSVKMEPECSEEGNDGAVSVPSKPRPVLWKRDSEVHGGVDGTASISNASAASVNFLEDREGDGGVRIGAAYQADIPELVGEHGRYPDAYEKGLLVWAPTEQISNEKISSFVLKAREANGCREEQSLGLLFWERYDVEKAEKDLEYFVPHPSEWKAKEERKFSNALQRYGKDFEKIGDVLPDKTIQSLVCYYYDKYKNKLELNVGNFRNDFQDEDDDETEEEEEAEDEADDEAEDMDSDDM